MNDTISHFQYFSFVPIHSVKTPLVNKPRNKKNGFINMEWWLRVAVMKKRWDEYSQRMCSWQWMCWSQFEHVRMQWMCGVFDCFFRRIKMLDHMVTNNYFGPSSLPRKCDNIYFLAQHCCTQCSQPGHHCPHTHTNQKINSLTVVFFNFFERNGHTP